jgi:hypothetical protein
MELSSDTAELLRPHQVSDLREEIGALEGMLNAAPHVRAQITDRGSMRRRADRLKRDLDKLTPRAFGPDEKDAAIREFESLSNAIRVGMPSSEEMRRNPPGAVGKQMAWDKRNKRTVSRYKHLALRLLAGGDVPDHMKHAGDVANVELLRPLTTRRDLDMNGAQIPKTVDIHFGADPVGTVLFSDEEEAALKELSPVLASQLGILSNDARAEIKALLARAIPAAEAAPAAKPTIKELGYNEMKKLAAKHGVNCVGIKKADLIVALRNRHLIQ